MQGSLRLEQRLVCDTLHSNGQTQPNMFSALVNFSYWRYFSRELFPSPLSKYFYEVVTTAAIDSIAELRKLACEQVLRQLNFDELVFAWDGFYSAIEVLLLHCESSQSVLVADEDLLSRLLRSLGEQSRLQMFAERLRQKLQATSPTVSTLFTFT